MGFRTDIASFVREGGEIVYQGDLGVMGVQIGAHTNMPVNIPGSELIGTTSSTLLGINDFHGRIDASTVNFAGTVEQQRAAAQCSSSRSWAFSRTPRCTATSCASGSTR